MPQFLKSNQLWRLVFFLLAVFSFFHLIRDILQIYHVDNLLTTSFNTSKNYCNPYCDYITIPPEIFVSIGSIVILIRKNFGILAKLVLLVFVIWAITFWQSYFYR